MGARGQPTQYSGRSTASGTANHLQTVLPRADGFIVRTLLEFLGIVEPDRTRREPVALPAWSRRMLPVLPFVLALASTLVLALVRAIVG